MINELWGTRDKKIKQGLRIFFQGKCLNLVDFFLIFYITGDIFFLSHRKEIRSLREGRSQNIPITCLLINLIIYCQEYSLHCCQELDTSCQFLLFFFSFLFQLLLSLFFLLSKFIKFVHVTFTVKKCSARRKKISSLNFLFFFSPSHILETNNGK